MFTFWCGETGTDHNKGHLCTYASDYRYLIVQHHNDFMYDINKEIRFGNGGELLILSPGSKIVHGSPKDSGLRYIDDWIIVSGEHISTHLSELRLTMNVSFDIGTHGL